LVGFWLLGMQKPKSKVKPNTPLLIQIPTPALHARISPPHPSPSLRSLTRACSNAVALLRLRLRCRGCVAATASSVLAATSSVLAVPLSQSPSFRQESSNVSPFIVQSSPSTDPFTTVLFPIHSLISPNLFATVRVCPCALPSSRGARRVRTTPPRHTPSYPSDSSPMLVP
jgi:hypothetical protein